MARPTGSSGTEVPPVLPSIPLSPERPVPPGEQSIGELVRDITTHVSTLVRSEVELARAEVTREVRKGLQGSVFFIAALTVLLFSLFFLFTALAELLINLGLYSSAAYAIVFGLMLLIAGLFGLLGYLRVRKIRKPERTIESLKDSAALLSARGRAELDGSHRNGSH